MRHRAVVALLLASGALAGCGWVQRSEPIAVDGSSTVYPIMAALAEEYRAQGGEGRVVVRVSGTGGGFERFCAGEIDISDASREIADFEREMCLEEEVEFLELPLGVDGLTLIVNPENDFLECLTVEELAAIWRQGSGIDSWRDLRPDFPPRRIQLFGPGTSSGTFDFFTGTVLGPGGASRPDYQASEDDNYLVQGIAGDPYALGYFGYAYYRENRDRLKAVAVDGGSGCVLPSEQTIEDGTYTPLARQLLIYVNRESLSRPEVRDFVRFAMERAFALIPGTGYIPLSPERYQANLEALARAAGEAP